MEERLKEIKDDPAAMQDFMDQVESAPIVDVKLYTLARTNLNKSNMAKLDQIRTNPTALSSYLEKLVDDMAKLEKSSDEYSALYMQEITARRYLANCRVNDLSSSRRSGRVAEISFQVESTKLKHTYDLERITEDVMSLFDWHTNETVRDKYMAPYFPLVQSSGMGKTKLLWELRECINNDEYNQFADFDCRTILCLTQITSNDNLGGSESLFSTSLRVSEEDSGDLARKKITARLDSILDDCKNRKVILLFDETQHLLQNDGFAFRCVRWWLRLQRGERQVVAVFTGTTSRLTNFFAEPKGSTFSRDANANYFDKGTVLNDPFYDLFTVGIFANDFPKNHGQTEYEQAIPYGRPLFALVHQKGELTDDALFNILHRMLLSSPLTSWMENLASCVSILGARIQMGPTSASLASELVSKGTATQC